MRLKPLVTKPRHKTTALHDVYLGIRGPILQTEVVRVVLYRLAIHSAQGPPPSQWTRSAIEVEGSTFPSNNFLNDGAQHLQNAPILFPQINDVLYCRAIGLFIGGCDLIFAERSQCSCEVWSSVSKEPQKF